MVTAAYGITASYAGLIAYLGNWLTEQFLTAW